MARITFEESEPYKEHIELFGFFVTDNRVITINDMLKALNTQQKYQLVNRIMEFNKEDAHEWE